MDRAPLTIDVRILDQPVQGFPAETFPQTAGAECVFLGRTRREVHPEHGRLVRLSYEAYEALAQKILSELAQEAARRFGCHLVRVHHATGEVAVGEASVLVQVAAGHRDKAFAACRFLIDEIKSTAPIWKRELWADGTSWSTGTPVSC